MAFSARVTRTELALADLSITSNGYFILSDPAFDSGGVAWRRTVATSPFVHGDVEIHRVKEMVSGTLSIFINGLSVSDVQAKLAALIAAFSQDSYIMLLTIDAVDYSWKCRAADYNVLIDDNFIRNKATVTLGFQRHPIPATGPY